MAVLRAQGMAQQQVAEEMGMSRENVKKLETIGTNNPNNVRIISTNDLSPSKPSYGNSKTHTIARLKRDSQAWKVVATSFEGVVAQSGSDAVAEVATAVATSVFTEGLLRNILYLAPGQPQG